MIEQYTKLIGNSFFVVSLMRGFKAFISAIYLFEGRLAQSHLSRKLHDIICARKSILPNIRSNDVCKENKTIVTQ